jgi:hypothetical protein
LGLELAEQRHHLQPPERHRHVDAQPASRLEPCLLEHQLGLFELGQALPAALEEGGAVVGQADAPGRTRQQPHAELTLEPADRVADARLRDAEVGGGAHEAAPLGHLHENRQSPQVLHGSIHHY